MKKSLKVRLAEYLTRVGQPVASGALQRKIAEETTYTPRTVVRRLEELVEEGVLTVEYRKGHSWYAAKGVENPKGVDYVRHPRTGQLITTAELASL